MLHCEGWEHLRNDIFISPCRCGCALVCLCVCALVWFFLSPVASFLLFKKHLKHCSSCSPRALLLFRYLYFHLWIDVVTQQFTLLQIKCFCYLKSTAFPVSVKAKTLWNNVKWIKVAYTTHYTQHFVILPHASVSFIVHSKIKTYAGKRGKANWNTLATNKFQFILTQIEIDIKANIHAFDTVRTRLPNTTLPLHWSCCMSTFYFFLELLLCTTLETWELNVLQLNIKIQSLSLSEVMLQISALFWLAKLEQKLLQFSLSNLWKLLSYPNCPFACSRGYWYV